MREEVITQMSGEINVSKVRIESILPHRDWLLLLDRAVINLSEKFALGYYLVSPEHPVFNCHFPGNPLFPGNFQTEMLAQLAGVFLGIREGRSVQGVLRGLDGVKFRRSVRPNDFLKARISLNCAHRERRGYRRFHQGDIRVRDTVVCEVGEIDLFGRSIDE